MSKESEEKVIAQYQEDEANMILLFVQWCVNHDINPYEVYKEAYPDQTANELLKTALDHAVSKEEAEPISTELLLEVLDFFGNYELAQVIYKNMEAGKNNNH
jgi:hypothetical protein